MEFQRQRPRCCNRSSKVVERRSLRSEVGGVTMQLKICFALLVQSGRGMRLKTSGFPVRVWEGAPNTGHSLEDRQESSKFLYVGSNPTASLIS